MEHRASTGTSKGQARRIGRWAVITVAASLLVAGCHRQIDSPAPPRVTSPPALPRYTSTLQVPVTLSLDELQRVLERKAPRQLWSINEHRDNCVPAQRIKVFGAQLKVTPDLGCQIIGQVTRGPLRLSGRGSRLDILLPVNARISARDVGGILKGETATGSAVVRATVRLHIDKDWTPRAKVDVSYDWTEPPGIDFLGQRVKIVRRADRELVKVVADLERDLQAEVARLRVKPYVADAWRDGFAVIELNRDKPPAWMRVTPQGIGVTGLGIAGRTVTINVAAEAQTETFIGDRPEPAVPVPLPAPIGTIPDNGLRFHIPVMADYRQLEPVVLRALTRLAEKEIALPGIGRVRATFSKVTIYATENQRLAVGIDAEVKPVDLTIGQRWTRTKGRIWLTGRPVHARDSQVVRIEELAIYGDTDQAAGDLLLSMVASEAVKGQLAASLIEDFSREFTRVLAAAQKAVASRNEGGLHLAVHIDEVRHGLIQVTGTGLFLPVEVSGRGRITLAPK